MPRAFEEHSHGHQPRPVVPRRGGARTPGHAAGNRRKARRDRRGTSRGTACAPRGSSWCETIASLRWARPWRALLLQKALRAATPWLRASGAARRHRPRARKRQDRSSRRSSKNTDRTRSPQNTWRMPAPLADEPAAPSRPSDPSAAPCKPRALVARSHQCHTKDAKRTRCPQKTWETIPVLSTTAQAFPDRRDADRRARGRSSQAWP